jgi:hypothetical protein
MMVLWSQSVAIEFHIHQRGDQHCRRAYAAKRQ